MSCLFCEIVSGQRAADHVFEDAACAAFLDHRPLFPGHVLLVPKPHHETLADLPAELVAPLFSNAQAICRAVEHAMQAEGTFLALNNRVSQSVPHLHIHVVPRRKKDGLKGFFWPRQRYASDDARQEAATRIRAALAQPR
jgi:histidine triad (HIT) family protein